MGHAYDQQPIHKSEDQAGMINRSMDVIEKFTGTRPVGWLGPGLTQTLETPELLAKAGVKYIGDWVYDDEPTVIKTAEGPAGHAALHGRAERHPDDDRAAPRERLSAQARDRPVRPALRRGRATARRSWRWRSIPTSSGQPHRIKYLEAIYDYVRASTACCTGTACRSSTGTSRSPPTSSRRDMRRLAQSLNVMRRPRAGHPRFLADKPQGVDGRRSSPAMTT